MAVEEIWGADVPVSLPAPLKVGVQDVYVDFGGFAFTLYGVAHNLTESDWEELVTPTFAPSDYIPGAENRRLLTKTVTQVKIATSGDTVGISEPISIERRAAQWDDPLYLWDDSIALWDDHA